MSRFLTAFSRALDVERATEELIAEIVGRSAGAEGLAGGLILATAAAGKGPRGVAAGLAERWPDGSFFGTSFEGVIADGQMIRDEPALMLLAWLDGPVEPVPLVLPPGAQTADQLAEEIRAASGRDELAAGDLVLLFPDALASNKLEQTLSELAPLLAPASLAGAAASGLDGHPAEAFLEKDPQPGALLGLFLPAIDLEEAPRVRCAGASRTASPWLEITECRSRWVDGLESEPPLDWVRRQLGLDSRAPIEPHLGQLLARVQRPPANGVDTDAGNSGDYEERYVIGLDNQRGSFSWPGRLARGDQLALALPDPEWARQTLRTSILEMPRTSVVLQFACRARDEAFYGDPDLESAWVAHHAGDRRVLGTISPFQVASDPRGTIRLLVHSTVLAALGGQEI